MTTFVPGAIYADKTEYNYTETIYNEETNEVTYIKTIVKKDIVKAYAYLNNELDHLAIYNIDSTAKTPVLI